MRASDKGRKQHIATDTLGLLLALVITAASVQDTNGGKDVADRLAAAHPAVTAGWVDGGCKTGFLEHAAAAGISFAVVRDPPGTLRNHDPLGHDRQHEQKAYRRIHPNLARRPCSKGEPSLI
jgi:hypothetical protein